MFDTGLLASVICWKEFKNLFDDCLTRVHCPQFDDLDCPLFVDMIVTLVTFFGWILLKLANGGCIQTKFISSFLKRLSSYLKLKASLFICVHAFWSWTYAFFALRGDGIESLLLPKITNAKNNFIVCV